MPAPGLIIDLNAVITMVSSPNPGAPPPRKSPQAPRPTTDGYEPRVLLDNQLALPSGPFETGHRTLEQGLRNWVETQSGQPLGYIEQLYTFADRDRTAHAVRTVSIGYLALVAAHNARDSRADGVVWSSWYRHFPWEDHRDDAPAIIAKTILPALIKWKSAATDAETKRQRTQRIDIAFPTDPRRWNEELVLQRYELLWEAGLVDEARTKPTKSQALGLAMAHDHRRILATGMARLRAKIKYRPVVFELLPEKFTLLQLQSTVEALAGLRLHKQNFRRLVESQGLVDETGGVTQGIAGRPAKLFAFRREVLQERAVAGTKLTRIG